MWTCLFRTEFGKTLRKTVVIPEKEPENVIADTDTNMSEDTSVNPVGSVNTIEMAEQVIAESDRRAERIIADSQEFAAEFGDTPLDEFDDWTSLFEDRWSLRTASRFKNCYCVKTTVVST